MGDFQISTHKFTSELLLELALRPLARRLTGLNLTYLTDSEVKTLPAGQTFVVNGAP